MQLRDFLLALTITAVWGVNFSFIRLGLNSLDPFVLAGIRFLLCAIPMVLFVRRPAVPLRVLALYGIIFGTGLWGMVNVGIKLGLSPGVASLLLQLSAFITIALGVLLFGEKITRGKMVGFVMAFLGLALIASVDDGAVTLLGTLFVLLGAFSWSVANTIVKRTSPENVFAFLIWSSLFSPIPLFALGYAVNGSAAFAGLAHAFDGKTLASIAFQVYPTTLFGYWIWNGLMKKYPVSSVAPISLLVPVFGFCASVLIFDEVVGFRKLAASGLIILGLAIVQYDYRLVALWRAQPLGSRH
jgi:O-acetylserine/cysteine efflux transporter